MQSIQIPAMTFMMEVLMTLGYTQQAVVLLGRAFMDDYDQDFNKFVENSITEFLIELSKLDIIFTVGFLL